MKWIAKRDFYRVPQLADVEITEVCKGADKNPPHDNHIHTGAIFVLGKSKDENELRNSRVDSVETKLLIAQLRCTGCIGDASDKDVVTRVEKEVSDEKKRLAEIEKRNAQTDNSKLIEAFTTLLQRASAEPAK